MRKLAVSLLLPLLMLFSQQGALWHEIGHLGGAGAPAREGKQQPIDRLCEQCLAYGAMAAAAAPFVAPLALAELGFAAPLETLPPFVAAQAPSARSRGPPRTL